VKLLGLPLIDVARSGSPRRAVAIGWVGVGPVACGVLVSIGGVAIGAISLGGLGIGLFVVAGVALGVAPIGGLAVGVFAFGGAAVGLISAMGGLAVARELAPGGARRLSTPTTAWRANTFKRIHISAASSCS
jgi:hypothetical protein